MLIHKTAASAGGRGNAPLISAHKPENGLSAAKNAASNFNRPFLVNISAAGEKLSLSDEMRKKIRALDAPEALEEEDPGLKTIAEIMGKIQTSLEDIQNLVKISAADDPRLTGEDRATIQDEIDKVRKTIPDELAELKKGLTQKPPNELEGETLLWINQQEIPAEKLIDAIPDETVAEKDKNLQDHLLAVSKIDVSTQQGAQQALNVVDAALKKVLEIKERLGYDKDGKFIGYAGALSSDAGDRENKIRFLIKSSLMAIFAMPHLTA